MLNQDVSPASSAIQWGNLLVGAALGSVIGFVGSRVTAWRDRVVHERKVARNLLQETRRIRDELGQDSGSIVLRDGSNAFVLPTVHVWMQALISEAALINGDIVGDFMRLDRELNNLAVLQKWYVAAADERSSVANLHGSESLQHLDAKENVDEKRKEYRDAAAKIAGLLDRIGKELEPRA